MWLSKSSVGRKVVMSVTGLALILFLLFHMSMNLVAIFSAEAYNMVCAFLGANWYALVASLALAVLAVIHIFYATWLTLMNRKARGNDRYAVTARPKGVSWESKNMFVLGLIIFLGLILHLCNFWAKMQLAELMEQHDLGIEGVYGPQDGAGLIRYTFSNPIYVILYIIWLVALWFHLTHGFWSALQTLGWNGKKWLHRIQVISTVFATIIVLGFAVVVCAYFFFNLEAGALTFTNF